jgi:hypothetical protein
MRATVAVVTVAAAGVAGVAAEPTPPVFPSSWSAHVHTIVKQVAGSTDKLECDFAFDSVTNQTSYRNCGGLEQVREEKT